MTSLLGAATFSFWMWLYPQAMNYQEQNQLFLFTWDYLGERLSLPGGFADWLSEFLVQFFYYPAAGALIMAVLAVLLQLAVWNASGKKGLYGLSFIPSLLLFVYMGDFEVLLSFPVALILCTFLCPLYAKAGWHRLWLIPLTWWLAGPLAIVPVLYSVIISRRPADLLILLYTLFVFYAGHRLFTAQYPLKEALFGLNYYRLRNSLPVLQIVIPAVTLLCVFACSLPVKLRFPVLAEAAIAVLLVLGTVWGVRRSFDKDACEILAYDSLIRQERYQEVIDRAEKYQPHDRISACSVNLCLFMEGRLLSDMDRFYQCGTEGLVLPSVRDNVSDISSAELLWMMGMPNITLQYCFDLQESIQNGRKSGRFMSRIAECNIVNGWYDRAEKYLDILEHTLFYRRWARSRKEMIQDEKKVASDPVYSYIRRVRFKDDFITMYNGLDGMMAILYTQERNNFMAGEYYTAWQRLKGKEDVQ